jgi:hypothetical protein
MINVGVLWVTLSRAIEIAKVGNFTVTVYWQSEYANGFEDYGIIKNYYKGYFEGFVADGDIWVEIVEPENYEARAGLTLADRQVRVDTALANEKPTTIHNAGNTLLKHAIDKLELSAKDITVVKNRASVIAQIDGEKQIKPEDIAEAIQYSKKVIINTDVIGELPNSKFFGSKITVDIGDIAQDDAKAAIEYLSQFI